MNINFKISGISADVICGENVHVVQPVNLYGCTLGDNVFVGPFVEVQQEVRIGKNCKIQSHSFICGGVVVGSNCFIGHGVMFVNDLFKDGKPAGGDKLKLRSAVIGNDVSIGSNATILSVKICDCVVIGAGSVVTRDITKAGIYAGNPARFMRALNK
jgi:acetyltransferase-like isoleucine patch superfamily enzyme